MCFCPPIKAVNRLIDGLSCVNLYENGFKIRKKPRS